MPQQPLADRIRPNRAEDYAIPQEAESGPSSIRTLLDATQPWIGSSIILWGPPGSGKTTLARLIAAARKCEMVELAAISAGVAQVREVLVAAQQRRAIYDLDTVLFIDEFHRFSSSQQDSLLAAVEAGTILLIAATTENPSVSVTRPLLSRSRVFELKAHNDESLAAILRRAMEVDPVLSKKSLSQEALVTLLRLAGGDARIALGLLEAAAASAKAEITPKDVEQANQTVPNFDRAGTQHYSVISAFIKSVRGSDADAALQYLAMMIAGGEDPMFIARRLVILAAEDIGLADPQALQLATAAASATALVGLPEARIPLAEATIYLALAPKSNSAYLAINSALAEVSRNWPTVPDHLINHSPQYRYPHDSEKAIISQQYGATLRFYEPKPLGAESVNVDRIAAIRRILRGDDRA